MRTPVTSLSRVVIIGLIGLVVWDAWRIINRIDSGDVVASPEPPSWIVQFNRGLAGRCEGGERELYDPCRLGIQAARLSGEGDVAAQPEWTERQQVSIAAGMVQARAGRMPERTASLYEWDGWAFAEMSRYGFEWTRRRCADLGVSTEYDVCLFGMGRAAVHSPELLAPVKSVPNAFIEGYRVEKRRYINQSCLQARHVYLCTH